MGTHGHRGVRRLVLGSVAEEVLDAEADEIIDVAEKRKAAFIITATHGRTELECMLMGSVAEKVLRQASCPVCVVKSFGRSLVEDDKSPGA
jgi:nucleotide-binding universal stress UspA family protein